MIKRHSRFIRTVSRIILILTLLVTYIPINGKGHDKVYVEVTCYQPTRSQCGPNPLITADGSKIDMNKLKNGQIKWIAVSRDLERIFPMGSTIKLTNEKTGKVIGTFVVRDRMHKRWHHKVDILIHTSSKDKYHLKNIRAERVH